MKQEVELKLVEKYPKTYKECAKELGYNRVMPTDHILGVFLQLLNCRDAYWKIAGEQMGLGEPWNPDRESDKDIYTIEGYSGTIGKDITCRSHLIFAFPTEEMRDAFFENFKDLIDACKDLIEDCKELL